MNVYTMPNGDVELGDFTARRNLDATNVVWIITEQCNLGCNYCIGFKSQGSAKSLIDTLGVDQIVARFEKIRNMYKKQLYITLTGGEPTIVPKFPQLCKQLVDRGFIIELQSNLISSGGVRAFVDAVNPKGVGQIMATYHGWALDSKFQKFRENYFSNFSYAVKHGITCVFKTVVPPDEVFLMGPKLDRIRKLLPDKIPIMPWLFISGVPKSLTNHAGAYPYSYNLKQHEELDRICSVRGQCQKLYRGGAGFFRRMQCDAGRGFIVMTWQGHVSRCYTIRTGSGYLGDFTKMDVKLNTGPTPCTSRFCGTSFWGMWFGTNPWAYVPGAREQDAYYCRFGPAITQQGE